MNLHWQRTYTEGNIEKVADTGAIYTPPTMFAIEGKVNVELQELVTSWNGYMGMNTAFTRSSKIQCLRLDRYASGSGDDPGAAIQLDWNLNIPETVLLPIKSPQEPEQIFMEYRVVGGIIHRGRDNEGHVQAVCRNLVGWSLVMAVNPFSADTNHLFPMTGFAFGCCSSVGLSFETQPAGCRASTTSRPERQWNSANMCGALTSIPRTCYPT